MTAQISRLTKATDDAYTLSALITVCGAALEQAENEEGQELVSILSGVRRTLREVVSPMAGASIDALELAEKAAQK